jgi:hypothetical protein
MHPKKLRDFAARCLEAARIFPAHEVSGKLRAMARKYTDAADAIDRSATQQQQQIQPDQEK